VLVAAGLVALAGATVWSVLVPALALLAAGMGFASPTMTSLVTERAHHQRRGAALGFQQSAGALARIAGPALAGVLFDHAGVAWPYVVGAVLVAVAFTVLLAERTPAGASLEPAART
jgi:DHA1 family tetracycline resistance protein-like MFS transporter